MQNAIFNREFSAAFVPALDLQMTRPDDRPSWMEEELVGPYCSLMNYWLLVSSGKRVAIVFS